LMRSNAALQIPTVFKQVMHPDEVCRFASHISDVFDSKNFPVKACKTRASSAPRVSA
jgi:hypothetical protein